MPTYKIAYNAATQEARVTTNATATPGGFTAAGSFVHDDDNNDPLEHGDNHAVFHHVRDALYKLGQQNMQIVKITYGAGVNIAPPSPG